MTLHWLAGPGSTVSGAGGPLTRRSTLSAEPLDPFGDGLRCRVELTGRVGLAQSALDDTRTIASRWRQRRLLLDFHRVSLRTLKLRNLS